MAHLRHWLLILLAGALAACTLTGNPATPTPVSTPTPLVTGKPTVTINSPTDGAEVLVGEDVLVSATATDDAGITSVQLFANERLVKSVSSETAAGDQTLPVVLDYAPRTAGELALEVVAYRGNVPSDPAAVTIQVLEENATVNDPIDDTTGPVIDPNDTTCRILTNVNLNYRTGPSTDYDRIGTFTAGTQAPITGRLGDNSWWQVRVNSYTLAWVSADFTTEYGYCAGVPVLAPPPTPTSTAATATPTPVPTLTLAPEPSATPTITNTPRPADLVVSNVSGPHEIALDGAASVSATYAFQITNTGDAGTVTQFENIVTIYPGGEIVELGVSASLGAGESIVLQRELTFTAEGEFTLQAAADSGEGIDEISEVNNVGTYVVFIQP
jgi:hypothetical protein